MMGMQQTCLIYKHSGCVCCMMLVEVSLCSGNVVGVSAVQCWWRYPRVVEMWWVCLLYDTGRLCSGNVVGVSAVQCW